MVETRRRTAFKPSIKPAPRKTSRSLTKAATPQRPLAKPTQPALVLPETGKTLELTVTQRVTLRQQAHRLDPVVLLGQAGLTDGVLLEIERALRAHGLIKVKAGLSEDKAERTQLVEQITQRLSAAVVQQIGKILVLYRPK